MPVREITVISRALKGNPLGDPHFRPLHVVLPPNHDPEEPLPCVWILAGFAGVGRQYLTGDFWQESIEDRLERLREEGKIGRMIVALPDAFTRWGGCQYLSSSAVGDYERYLWDELPAALGGVAKVSAHGVMGSSSGGFGALHAVARRPEMFGAVACHSGDMGFEMSVFPDIPHLMNAVRDHGSLEAFVAAHAEAARKKDGRWFMPIMVLALAAAYGPDPSEPMGIRLPFDLEGGTLDPEVLERWSSLDPVMLFSESEAAREALRRLQLVYFDCGRRDEHWLHWGARQLAGVLATERVPHEHVEYDGGHRGTSARFEVSLPKMFEALTRAAQTE